MVRAFLIYFLLFTCIAAPAADAGAGANSAGGEALVIFRTGVSLENSRKAASEHNGAVDRHFRALSKARGREMAVVRSRAKSTAELLAELKRDPRVEHAEANAIRIPFGGRPNDPRLGELWGLEKIKAIDAWGLRRTADPVVVAVIDTGVSIFHPDLTPVLWTNSGETPGNGLDDDGNGYVDDHSGYDFIYGKGDPDPTGAHGSHVAGIAAGAANNAIGIAGVARDARVMGLKVADESEEMTTAAIVEAIDYAVAAKKRGVNIAAINSSYGGDEFSTLEQEAIRAAGDAGIILCAAAGNSTSNLDLVPTYPASYRLSNMIVVAATDQTDGLASFSSYGANSVDLAAPGVQILSTVTGLTGWVAQASSVVEGVPMTFSSKSTGIEGTIYDCGLGYPEDFPLAVLDNIALISRGTLTFADKVRNAMAAGARAAVIYNNTTGVLLGTLGGAGNWIPTIGISQSAGTALKAMGPTTGQVAVISSHDQYDFMSGTSMATPYVSGAVAFAAMQHPQDSVTQRIKRLTDSVDKIPGLTGKTFSGGRLNLKQLIDADGDDLPDWWEIESLGSIAATPDSDPDEDGVSNIREFAADTQPSNKESALGLSKIELSASKVHLEWVGGICSLQYLQAAPALSGPWTDIITNQPPTPIANSVDVASSPSQRFFRMRSERP